MSLPPCSACSCTDSNGATTHAVIAALMADDLDRAIEAGLLESVPCSGCSDECTALLVAARDARLRALAARERYRARQARLQRRAAERAAARATPASAAAVTTHQPKPSLPSAAAAALERAKARAAERRKP